MLLLYYIVANRADQSGALRRRLRRRPALLNLHALTAGLIHPSLLAIHHRSGRAADRDARAAGGRLGRRRLRDPRRDRLNLNPAVERHSIR